MIPSHERFVEAVKGQMKVWVSFYSAADGRVLERVCAPLDYGPTNEVPDSLNRYWLWDYAPDQTPHTLGLLPQQIVDLQVLGEVFDPGDFGVLPTPWTIPRDWASTR